MIDYIKKKIRNYIVKFLVDLVEDVKCRYDQEQISSLKNNLQYIGSDLCILYPFFISGEKFMTIGNNFYAGYGLRMDAISNYEKQNFEPKILIGNNVSIQSNCHLGSINKIVIEDGVMIASNVYISDHSHGNLSSLDMIETPSKRDLISKGPVIIRKNVWIGDSVCILSGVTIGENAIIGANAVVTKDVPSNSIVAGIPAKIIKQL
jgi:acetyltransferase-like isoleucine patch superfamily enzyme